MNYRRNSSGYSDPTAGVAMEHMVRDERRRHRQAAIREKTAPEEQPETQKRPRQRYVNAPKHRRP